jgi:CRP-like cAMP-binding protein
VLELLTTRLRESDRHRIEYGARSALARVAARLIELHDRFPDGNLRLTQDELAAWVGCSREAAAKALAVLRSMDLVRTGRRRVEVVDQVGLEKIAGV